MSLNNGLPCWSGSVTIFFRAIPRWQPVPYPPPSPSRGCAGLASLCRPRCNNWPPCPPQLPPLQGCLEVDAGIRAAPILREWPGVLCREAGVGEGGREGEGEFSAAPPPLAVAKAVHTVALPVAERCPNNGDSSAVVGENRTLSLPAGTQCFNVGAPRWHPPHSPHNAG